jgi:hypothetical protein
MFIGFANEMTASPEALSVSTLSSPPGTKTASKTTEGIVTIAKLTGSSPPFLLHRARCQDAAQEFLDAPP